jgi:ABC-type branched-subunit amino acid transport system substrate-binding protein
LDNIFNASYFSFDSVNGLGKYVSEMDLPKKIYVHMNDPMINKVVNRFKIGYGSGLLLEEILPNDENYIRSTAIKIIAEDPDLIILSAWPNVGAQFVRHVLTQSKRQMLFAFDPLLDEGFSEYKKIVGDMTKLDGSIVPIQKKYDSAIFADLYKKRYGIAPSTGSDVAYDGFNVLVETYDKDWSDWVSNLRKYNKPGVTGEIKFDDVGLRLTDYKITNVVDGKIPLYSE